MNLDDLLQDISVHDPSDRQTAVEAGNVMWPDGWWGVSTPSRGLIAYFQAEVDAFRFRLDLINGMLNPVQYPPSSHCADDSSDDHDDAMFRVPPVT